MAIYKATVEIYVEVEDEVEVSDAIAESLRPHLPRYAENPEDTCWVDWRYSPSHSWPELATEQEIAELER